MHALELPVLFKPNKICNFAPKILIGYATNT